MMRHDHGTNWNLYFQKVKTVIYFSIIKTFRFISEAL
jgi:putative component of toxin-antitoxin plasmid stabilization module